MNRFMIPVKVITLLLLSSLLAACDRSHHKDLNAYTEQLMRLKVASTAQKPPLPVTFPTAVAYQAAQLREPFDLNGKAMTNRADLASPLLSYAVNMLRFVGTMAQNGKIFAYILTPDNMVYQIEAGDIIGTHFGKVLTILPNEVKIMESVPEGGKIVSQEVIMQLKEDN